MAHFISLCLLKLVKFTKNNEDIFCGFLKSYFYGIIYIQFIFVCLSHTVPTPHLSQPNEQNHRNGNTPLHIACSVRDERIVSFLCKYKADAKVTNYEGETPLSIATDNGDEEIVELLAPDTLASIHEHCSTGVDMAVLHKVMESRELSGHLGHHLDDEVPSLPVIDSGTSFNPTAALPRLSTFNVDSPRLHEMADDILDLKDSPRIGVTSNDSSISQDSNKENNPNLESHMASNDELESDDIAPDERPLLMNLKSSETFVSRLDDKEKLRMDATRIQRANPFTKLKREKTKKMLKEMHDIANAKEDLPKLAGWLEKRQPHLPYSWQKRWVVVKVSAL